MTTTEMTVLLLASLLPSVIMFAYLLLRRRQANRAEFEHAQLNHARWQLHKADEVKRTDALLEVAAAYAPILANYVQTQLRSPPPPSIVDIDDHELVNELERRMREGDWKQGNPFESLDDLLEQMWTDGVEVPKPDGTPVTLDDLPTPSNPPRTPPGTPVRIDDDLLEAVP